MDEGAFPKYVHFNKEKQSILKQTQESFFQIWIKCQTYVAKYLVI